VGALKADEPLIRDIADTARWVAIYRAMESERPDAVFRDPFARRLAGARGEEIARTQKWMTRQAWSYVARTYLFDKFVTQEVTAGADMVINLAAGLDTRPYRMDLPSSLQWIEVDLPDLIAYKEEVLRNEKPRCRLERVPLDLSNVEKRRALFADLGRRSKRTLILSEGLLIYLTPDEVCALGRDLAAPASFQRWATDLTSPGLRKMMEKRVGASLTQAGAPFKFSPEEGPSFFTQCGWRPLEVDGMLHTAAALKRLSFGMRLFTLFPDSKGTKPKQPWGGVVLLEKS
jgi:methyltransferase (TIGR00027 family)